MSAYHVTTENGVKKMHPVLSREQYMALRDSDQNRRAEKRHLVQMNYSCLPNDDGTLRGSRRMSTTVGMDIDEEIDTDFLLSKKEDLGLLMFENSATKPRCGHIVFRRHADMTQEQNLQWASSLLGVAYDQGAKDITRVFFTPADKLVFLDDALFGIEEVVGKAPVDVGTASSGGAGGGSSLERGWEGPPPASSLTAFDLCVEEAGLRVQQLDQPGVRHSNLMSVLSVGVPKLMPREQLEAVIRQRMPVYSQESECRSLLDYFYDKYSAERGFMSQSLREINAKAQADQQANDDIMEALTDDWTPPALPKRLPRIVELEISNFDPVYRETLAMTSAVGRAALASHFRAEYLNGKVITPAIMASVIGNSGSGKGHCTDLFECQMKLTIDDYERKEWEKVAANAELREKMKNSKEVPPKYHPKIRIFEGASKTSLLELQSNIGPAGMLVGLYSEADGFVTASQSSWSSLSVLLRKGFSGEKHRQFYMSESTCNTSTPLNISILMEGTPKAMLERLFNDRNCENGLMQRFIPVIMPKKKRTFRPPRINHLDSEARSERDALYLELFQKDLSLGDGTCVLETPRTNQAIGRWYDELEELYNDGRLTDAEADLSHRCGEFILRTAIPLIALEGRESKEIVDYSVWVGRMAFYNICRIYGHKVQKDLNDSDELMARRTDARRTAEPLLDQLPAVFSVSQMKEVRISNGQSADVNMLLSRYCKNGRLVRVGRGVYRKAEESNIITVINNTHPDDANTD